MTASGALGSSPLTTIYTGRCCYPASLSLSYTHRLAVALLLPAAPTKTAAAAAGFDAATTAAARERGGSVERGDGERGGGMCVVPRCVP